MASYSIQTRTLASGEKRYKATITVKKNGRIVHRFAKTHKKKAVATAWAKNQVTELEQKGINTKRATTIAELLDLFKAERDLWDNTGRTKQYVIDMLRDCDIAKVQTNQLATADLIEHCKNRKAAGAGPATVYHDVAYLRSVMKKANPVFNIEANYAVFEEAVPVLIDMKLVGKSQRRTRRPTAIELEKLKEGLLMRENYRPNGKNRIPFLDILDFSILTCMRIGEVCALRWEDLNEQNKTVVVRDRKDPRKKEGNHMLVPLLGDSFDIVLRQERKGDLIFPYNSRSVTAGFQRVRKSLGIEDLRYHDLRREGASRLFEAGYSIEEVAQVTGHRNLNILWQVYTQLFPHKLHNKAPRV
ncbi:TPA: site-specific integrase [Vibrio parahaemolyticus]|uniref:tyrosine-type recombinase/integrase n=1 Tax=Vibrio parahaemolyticus TaxID=670 RepID=UPI000934F39D|nr:site-specific integrase [Vibrio parahaemolyticus]MQF42687.1 site-specific integrase [Vibrio parahaemolyticus]TOZ99729.1 site-specific integrase [Vibrio parahaemolyticus]HCE1985944.1 site-specific integrase [Vibrio parahaemolyticus]HCG9135957.1 site-specific integrase [Vibrio parahaemolyticus]HCH0342449.1 site-specific integrase [Vibrio parahaemolyticus]